MSTSVQNHPPGLQSPAHPASRPATGEVERLAQSSSVMKASHSAGSISVWCEAAQAGRILNVWKRKCSSDINREVSVGGCFRKSKMRCRRCRSDIDSQAAEEIHVCTTPPSAESLLQPIICLFSRMTGDVSATSPELTEQTGFPVTTCEQRSRALGVNQKTKPAFKKAPLCFRLNETGQVVCTNPLTLFFCCLTDPASCWVS